MNNAHRLIKLWMMLVVLCFVPSAWAAQAPVSMLEGITNNMIASLAANEDKLKAQPHFVETLVNQYLLPVMDVDNMSRSVVGRKAWLAATPTQQQTFKTAFQKLVVRTYAVALAKYDDQKVKYAPLAESLAGRRFIQVNSVINQKSGPSINVNYRLALQGSQWKIYDFSVDGVSLVQSYRSQFAPIVEQHGMEGLLAKVQAHNSN